MEYILISHKEDELILIFYKTVREMLEKETILGNKMTVETYFNSFHRYVITAR